MPLSRFFPILLLLSVSVSAFAGDDVSKTVTPATVIQDPFAKGTADIEVLGGYYHSPIATGGTHHPQFDYAGGDFRWDIVLTPMMFDHSKIFRGNVAMLIDALGYGIARGPGNYLTGGSVLFRYNFLQPGSRVVPYFQLGGGGLHSDAAEDQSQRIIGANFEFILDADLGLRILLNDRWSLLLEGGFQHISNADTASRNVGVNALGGRTGFAWSY